MEEQSATEVNTTRIEFNQTPIRAAAKKPSRAPLIAAILLGVALLGALGYIVFDTIRDGSTESVICDTQSQTSQNNNNENVATGNEVSTSNEGQTCNNSTVATETTVGGPYIEGSYLYVPLWGIKYHLDDTLTDYGISYVQKSESLSYTPSVGLTAVQKSDLIAEPQAAYYDTIESCTMASIGQTTPNIISNLSGPREKYEYDGKGYVIYTATQECKYGLNLEAVSTKIINIFLHPEKI